MMSSRMLMLRLAFGVAAGCTPMRQKSQNPALAPAQRRAPFELN
jgi:hypothetical protein